MAALPGRCASCSGSTSTGSPRATDSDGARARAAGHHRPPPAPRAKVVAAARAPGPAIADTLLPQVYDDVPPRMHAMAMRSLKAHLFVARRRGARRRAGWQWRAALPRLNRRQRSRCASKGELVRRTRVDALGEMPSASASARRASALRGGLEAESSSGCPAALNSSPANQGASRVQACMKSNCRLRLGSTAVAIPFAAIARAIGLAKNGISAVAMGRRRASSAAAASPSLRQSAASTCSAAAPACPRRARAEPPPWRRSGTR